MGRGVSTPSESSEAKRGGREWPRVSISGRVASEGDRQRAVPASESELRPAAFHHVPWAAGVLAWHCVRRSSWGADPPHLLCPVTLPIFHPMAQADTQPLKARQSRASRAQSVMCVEVVGPGHVHISDERRRAKRGAGSDAGQ